MLVMDSALFFTGLAYAVITGNVAETLDSVSTSCTGSANACPAAIIATKHDVK